MINALIGQSTLRDVIPHLYPYKKGAQEAAFERGAAPITLIDGDKVLDLLIQYEIGVKKSPVYYYEFAPADLAQFADDDEEDL